MDLRGTSHENNWLQTFPAFRSSEQTQRNQTEAPRVNRPFAASHSGGTKPQCWRAKNRSGTRQIRAYIILNGNFLCLSCPSATFALQHGGFVPREWLAVKGLFHTLYYFMRNFCNLIGLEQWYFCENYKLSKGSSINK